MENVQNGLSVEKYLERIGYAGKPDGSLKALGDLQECHAHSVPYENLDVLLKRDLSLNISDIYHKVVDKRRGGWCFELNALFGWLLRQLGYQVTDYFARFLRNETGIPKRRHHVLRVDIDGVGYLCDVGVGGPVPFRPVKLVEGVEQPMRDECYRMQKDPFLGWILEEKHREGWRPIYSFTEEPQLPVDYVAINFYCQYAPDSKFNKQPMASIRTKEGRVTLVGNEFRIFTRNGVKTFQVHTAEEFRSALEKYFGIVLDMELSPLIKT